MNRKKYFLNNNEINKVNEINTLVKSQDIECVKLGISLFFELFGKYYISSNCQCWDISNQSKNKHGLVLLYYVMQILVIILNRKYLYYE